MDNEHPCIIIGCPKESNKDNPFYNFYCQFHYLLFTRISLHDYIGGYENTEGKCITCGSTNIHKLKLCFKHFNFINKRLGTMICIAEGCTEDSNKYGLCKKHLGAKTTGNTACKLLYHHEKSMKEDPEALTTEFMEEMIGAKCDKLKKEKENENTTD